MPLSLNLLTNVVDGNALLALQATSRTALVHQQSVMAYQLTQFDATTPTVEGGLTAVTAQLASIGDYINSLPAGSAERRKVELEKERLDVRQRLLSGRRETWGVVARIDLEIDMERVAAELTALDAAIALIQARIAAL